jgi:hypothetical protein
MPKRAVGSTIVKFALIRAAATHAETAHTVLPNTPTVVVALESVMDAESRRESHIFHVARRCDRQRPDPGCTAPQCLPAWARLFKLQTKVGLLVPCSSQGAAIARCEAVSLQQRCQEWVLRILNAVAKRPFL